jgi:hypothetical protein
MARPKKSYVPKLSCHMYQKVQSSDDMGKREIEMYCIIHTGRGVGIETLKPYLCM